MAFWGVEVKPGNPFKHEHDDTKGRLHLSMATLGLGTAEGRSILQCNIGNKSPVFLCTLYPVNSESLQVNLEFEEADDVVFSVLGPRSIFLSGYYVSTSQQEPCGEDIADTETDLSKNSDEDEYENSFIDDDEPEVYPPSPISNDEKEMLHNEKPKNGKGSCRWLRKSYQMSDSDDGGCSQPKNIVDGSSSEPVLQSEDKDSFPIVVLYKSKTTTKKSTEEVKSKADEGTGGTGDKKTEDDVNHAIEPKIKADNVIVDAQPKMQSDPPINSMPSASEVSPENGAKPKRKRKERFKEEKPLKADNANCSNILKEDKAPRDEARVDNMGQDMCMKNGQEWEAANGKGVELPDTVSLPSIEASPEDVERPKKRKKRLTKEGKKYEAEHKHSTVVEDNNTQQNDKEAELPENLLLPSAEVGSEPGEKLKKKSKQRARDVKASKSDSNHENVVREDGAQQNRAKAEDIVLGLPVTFKQNPNPANYKSLDSNSHVFADENHSSGKNIKKKKKNKTQENGKDLNMNTSLLSVDKKADDKSSQVWTLSNGLILEVLEMGKPDSKVAVSGKKISVNYNGKLKNNGESVDSNDGDAPFKFRLGVGKVMEGWDIGINGMQVGEKRRLIIPPSMGYGSKGHGENVPPDSWLVYDVELVKVH
ncbi:peptidyl-prolyl cis-trans isomerase FKBP43-like isoform X1 [Quercus robur]|uniref:peptidyl-prolyl cis-trans isomerase FKBP43-like isoform X1 n=1 Tax=Quercus robur TaxID=38942 RepID=UPI002161C177|nr:peptidyl-prolyl cis-trans isomerase FKBP43-like isoform X1 [Quercus robur]